MDQVPADHQKQIHICSQQVLRPFFSFKRHVLPDYSCCDSSCCDVDEPIIVDGVVLLLFRTQFSILAVHRWCVCDHVVATWATSSSRVVAVSKHRNAVLCIASHGMLLSLRYDCCLMTRKAHACAQRTQFQIIEL